MGRPKGPLRVDAGQAKMTVSGLQGADLNIPVLSLLCHYCLFEICQPLDCAGLRPTRKLGPEELC